ncbi:MAG: hypothetical protein M3340_12890 [Actinomycetota bacterium]|nr:hypothetical protein [Actinomycetota bacterium]
MRADLGPVAANLLMLAAGAGVLLGLRVPLRTWPARLGALGLAYVTGVGATMLALTALLVVGVPFGLVTFVATALAIGSAGAAAALLRLRREGPDPASARARPAWPLISAGRRPTVDGAAVIVFAVALAIVGVYGFDAMRSEPLDQWDGWSIWTRKAVMLVHVDTLASDFWTAPTYEFMHQDYPLVVPLLEAVFFRAGASVDTQAVHGQLWLLLVGFVWAAAWVAARVTRPVVWAPLLLLLLLAPGASSQLFAGYADVPMALFLGLGVLLAGLWLDRREPWQLWLAALMLGAAAGVKNEGLLGAVAALACLTAVVAAGRERRALVRVGAGWAVFLATVLPWRIWMLANDVSGDLPLGKGLDPTYLADRSDRFWPSVEALEGQMGDQGTWFFLIPLGAALAIAALIAGVRRAAAAFYLATGFTVFLGLVWAYWIARSDLAWHLTTSAYRVVAGVVLVCAAAALHLGGALAPGRAARD